MITLMAVGLMAVVVTTAAFPLLPPRQTGDVAIPAPDATPEQVVTQYLAALNAHDCDTAACRCPRRRQPVRGRAWCAAKPGSDARRGCRVRAPDEPGEQVRSEG